ncbi:hypothetical protein [Prosthecobacter sp.]|uniref:hypothetical protein n=1 Tax=Prosthecobacter sp. TaxID=1965333 RepID=UPI0024884489|nr:hypothetical protein [Prosthecobacter sp.]MDI1314903.1 hypothetical protein [Prosthecobacter sp.]
MKRILKYIVDFAVFLGALGLMAMLWLLLTQVVAIGLTVAVGLLIASFQGWGAGLVAGIITYAVLMKLAWYLDIFDMINIGRTSRNRSVQNKIQLP